MQRQQRSGQRRQQRRGGRGQGELETLQRQAGQGWARRARPG